jgi:transposase
MLHAGLDLSRRKLDVCLLSGDGEHLDQLVVPPDVDSLRTLARRIDEVHAEPVCGVVESMTGARLVHDTLEQAGWDVEIADAQRAKGLAPLALKTDTTDSLVLATLSQRDLVPAIWLPDPREREVRELARFRMHLVKHKSSLKNRVHSTLIQFGRPCPVTDLFGAEGRRLLARLEVPEPWRGNVTASVTLIDQLEDQIADINRRLRAGHADHPYVPLLETVPESAGCWRSRSPRRSARSSASRRRESSSATPAFAPGSCSRESGTAAGRSQSTGRPTCAGHCWRRRCTHFAIPPMPSATSARRGGSASSAGPRSPRSSSPAALRTRSGTCLPATRSSLPEAPLFVWRLDRPLWTCAPSERSDFA